MYEPLRRIEKPAVSPDRLELRNPARQIPYIIMFFIMTALIAVMFLADMPVESDGSGLPTAREMENYQETLAEQYKKKYGEEAYQRRETIFGGLISIVMLASVSLLVLLIIGTFKPDAPQIVPPGEKVPPGWGMIAVVKFIIIWFMVTNFAAAPAAEIVSKVKGLDSNSRALLLNGIANLWAVAVFLVILLLEYKIKASELGLTLKSALRGVKGGFLGYLAVLIPFYAFSYAWTQIAQAAGMSEDMNPVLGPLINDPQPILVFLTILLAVVCAPIAEEFFFRGLLYPALREKLGVLPGMLISGTLFGIVHAGAFQWPPLILLGVAFAWLYERTRSLTAPMVAHAVHNGISMITVLMFF